MQAASPFASPDLGIRDAIRMALQPSLLMRTIFTSAIVWLLISSAMPSYAQLIFNGKMADYFAAGLGITLVSQIVILVVTSLASSDHATIVIPQSPTAIIQGMIAASVVAAAPPDMSPEALFPLVYWIIVLSSLLTGGFILLLGITRAGGVVRYIPYPIVGGFLAGLGWFIFSAAFGVAVDYRISAETLPVLMTGDVFMRWLPALAFAISLLVLRTRFKNVMLMPGLIILAVALFYAWAYLVVGDADALAAAGWYVPALPESINWAALDLAAIARIDAAMIGASAGGILSLIIVCTLNVFFRASAQELVSGRELDFNRECTVNGAANIASGVAGGGVLGYHGPISTALVELTGVYGRLVGLILALLFWLTLMFGSALFSLVPRFLPAGLLMFFGLQFMKEWLLDSWFKLPRQDYIIVLVIALATALFGLLSGIALGLVLAMSFFVLEYSRMDVIKQKLSGGVHRSNLDRSYAENRFLQREGEKILILRLRGYLFFGTAYRFYEHVKRLIASETDVPLAYIVLDFKSVRGFDVSTVNDFSKLKQLSDRHGIELLFSNVLTHLQPLLEAGGAVRESGALPFFDDLDHALEWCENALLQGAPQAAAALVTVEQQLAQHAMIDSRDVSALHRYLVRVETKAGDVVVRQGEAADALYFIESGRVDVLLQGDGAEVLRLRSMTAGTVIGEVGFYLKKARTASIVVTEPGVLQRLSLDALRKMEASDPHTASALHMFIACALSDRLTTSNRLIQELMD